MKVWLLLRDQQYQEAEKGTATLDRLVAERRLHPKWIDFAREWLDYEKSVGTKQKEQASAALKSLVSEARGTRRRSSAGRRSLVISSVFNRSMIR